MLSFSYIRPFIQSWARFILQQLSSETLLPNKSAEVALKTSTTRDATAADEKSTPSGGEESVEPEDNHVSPVAKLFGVEQEQASRCVKCNTETSKVSPVLLSSLILQDLEGKGFDAVGSIVSYSCSNVAQVSRRSSRCSKRVST